MTSNAENLKKTVIGKSFGKNWLLSAFSNQNMPIPSPAPPHKRLWTRVFRIFFRLSN